MGLLLKVERTTSVRDVVRRHLPLFLITGAVILVAFIWSAERIPFRSCLFFRVTGCSCMSCGFTRSFFSLARGEFQQVLEVCPVAIILYGLTAMLFACNAAALAFMVKLSPGTFFQRKSVKVGALILLLVLLAANWAYRLMMGLT